MPLENAVVSAADRLGVPWSRSHPSKVEAARILHEQHGLPDATDLLVELNGLRKGEAYGEPLSVASKSADQIASDIETPIQAVTGVLRSS